MIILCSHHILGCSEHRRYGMNEMKIFQYQRGLTKKYEWLNYLFQCMSASMGIQLPRSFQAYKEVYTEICAWNMQTAFSVFPPLGDGRNTVGGKKKKKNFFEARWVIQKILTLLHGKIHTTSHSLQVVPLSFRLSSFLRTTATCANVGCLIQKERMQEI